MKQKHKTEKKFHKYYVYSHFRVNKTVSSICQKQEHTKISENKMGIKVKVALASIKQTKAELRIPSAVTLQVRGCKAALESTQIFTQ